MTRTAAPPRRLTSPTKVPAGRLEEIGPGAPPRSADWPRTALAVAGAGLVGYAAAPALGRAELSNLILAAGLVGAAVTSLLGIRSTRRRAVHGTLVVAVALVLGWRRADYSAVRVSRWRGGWIGTPQRVQMRYSPAINDADPEWLPAVVDIVGRRLLMPYRVVRHDRRRCRIKLEAIVAGVADAVPPAVQLRAERTVRELLGASAAVEPHWRDGELAALTVRHDAGVKVASPNHRARVERVLSTMLPGRWRARWDLESDTVRFELRPMMQRLVPHPIPAPTAANWWRLPLAVDEDGETIEWDLAGVSPHALVVGRTGTGKTVVINGIVVEASARGWRVLIIDPKRIEFLGMRRWPNVQVVATTVQDQVAVIFRAWELMEERYALIESGAAVESDFEPVILVLDEYRDFHGAVGDWYATVKVPGMPAKCPVFEKVSSLARKGRSARIHLVLGCQRPDADWLTGEMRDNFAARISLGRLSPQGAMMMWEAPYHGVAIPKIPGRGTASAADERPVEVQAYWTPDPRRAVHNQNTADLALLKQLRPRESTHPSLQVQMRDDLLNEPDEKGRTREWQAVREAQLVPSMDVADGDWLVPHPSPASVLATRPAGAAEPARLDELESVRGVDEFDEGDGYGPETSVAAGHVRAGDLVMNESNGEWVVVESAEPDVTDDGYVCIDWRGDDDDSGLMEVPADDWLTVRRPVDDFGLDLP